MMRKTSLLMLTILLPMNTAHAFLIEEHCDDFTTFEISNYNACQEICPNREVSTKMGGTSYEHFSCHNSIRDKGGEYDVLDAVADFTKVYCEPYYENGNLIKITNPENCVKKAIEEGRDFINVKEDDELYPNVQELCSDKNGYELNDDTCIKKCPKDKPLTGYAHDCYPCDTKYEIMLDNCRDYSIKDTDLVNVCPNRVIIRGSSYRNVIDSCNTIDKVKYIIKEGKYNIEDDGQTEFGRFSLLEWNVMFNHDPEVIKYLLDNDPKEIGGKNFILTLAIDKNAPESIMRILLDKAKKDDLIVWVPHSILYDVSLESGESWEVPLSFYAKYAGAGKEIQNLIKSYEKKFGIDYEPKIWVHTQDDEMKE